jgi:hypothetical protein
MNAASPNIADEQSLLHLQAAEIHTIDEPGEMVIRCAHGAAWVTQSGMAQDVVLEAGGSFHPRAAGKVIVQPMFGALTIMIERE